MNEDYEGFSFSDAFPLPDGLWGTSLNLFLANETPQLLARLANRLLAVTPAGRLGPGGEPADDPEGFGVVLLSISEVVLDVGNAAASVEFLTIECEAVRLRRC